MHSKRIKEEKAPEIHDNSDIINGQTEGNKEDEFNELNIELIMRTANYFLPGAQMFVRDLFMPNEIAAKVG